MIVTSFAFFLTLVFALGIYSSFKSEKTAKDYYLAGSGVKPVMTALSAVATLNSGWVFSGLVGFTYVAGLSSIWLSLGMFVGDFCASLFSYKQIRIATGRSGALSYAAVLANWREGVDLQIWRRVAAIMIVFFLSAYAAAQIVAGDKALQAALGWGQGVGAVLTAIMVLLYSTVGGIRASIWTDAAQFVIMLVAIALLLVAGFDAAGGFDGAVAQWRAIPGYLGELSLPQPQLAGAAGPLLFFLGWVVAGFSVIGQPHIMVRYMALESPEKVNRTRLWYYSFYFIFVAMVTVVGLLCRILLPELGAVDPELSLPMLAQQLLPGVLVGFMLAGVFAAAMSTVDSMVLSVSAAITNDLLPSKFVRPWVARATTGAFTVVALAIALSGSQSVFSLVILAWSTLGTAFGPILIMLSLNRRIGNAAAIASMAAGFIVQLLWRQNGYEASIYEGLPGMAVGLAVAYLGSRKLRHDELGAASSH
ncbi:MAG: sodium/proline symporter [Pseudomonadota bacterium]